MKITADEKCYLTEVANVSLDKRTFKKTVIVSTSEEASQWKQISEEEKISLEAQKAIFDNQEITPDYLQKVSLLISGIKEKANDTSMTAEEALANKKCFPDFEDIVGRNVKSGFRFNSNNVLFEAVLAHKVSAENKPVLDAVTLEERSSVDSKEQLYKVVTKD